MPAENSLIDTPTRPASAPSVLYVTRAFPPVVGGMEKLSAELAAALKKNTRTRIIANRHGKKALFGFFLWTALRLRRAAAQADIVYFGDPLLTVLLPLLGKRKKPVAVTVHGLDLLYPSPIYQALLRRFLPRVDLALCISRFAESNVRERFPQVKTLVITPGIAGPFRVANATRTDLERELGRPLVGHLLLAVARLVRRKGLAWFVAEVLPKLPDTSLLILGDGPERTAITEAAQRAGVGERVILAGTVPLRTLQTAYSVSDLLIMPNIPVPKDAEGFGLVALEAASVGLPVVAANIEGIPDAVIPNETGVLVPAHDAAAWSSVLTRLLRDSMTRQQLSNRAPKVVRERFSWDRRASDILRAFSALTPR